MFAVAFPFMIFKFEVILFISLSFRSGAGYDTHLTTCPSGRTAVGAEGRFSCLVHNILLSIKMLSSCEIEDFAETHICKLWVVLGSRVFLRVPSLRI